MRDYAYTPYREYREVRPAGTRPNTRKKKRRKRRKNRTLLLSLVLLVLLGSAVLIYQFLFNKAESIVSMEPTPISTDSTYLNTGDGILYQTDGQIHFYHLKDSKKNYNYGMGASDIRMSGSSNMTVVFNSASLQVIGEKEPISFTGEVREVECGREYLAVLRRGADGADSVIIQTPAGEQIGEPLAFPDEYVVDFGFYTVGGEKLWIESLNVNAGIPSTTISTYDLGKQSITGVMNIQGQLIDKVYVTADSMFVIATNQIIRYTHDGNKEVYREMIYGYEVVDCSNASGTPTFLMTPRGGDFHTVKVIALTEGGESDAVETYLQLPAEGVYAFIMGSRLVVASREKLFTYTTKGKLSSTAAFEQPIDTAIKLNDSVLMLSSNGTYYLASID